MQRTVYSTKFTFVENKINEKNEIASCIKTVTIHEADEKKALKKAVKEIGLFAPLKIEKISTLYVLDDEIFFKYAKPVTDDEEPEEGNPVTDDEEPEEGKPVTDDEEPEEGKPEENAEEIQPE